MAAIEQFCCKNIERPDETRRFKAHGHLDLLDLGEGLTIGRAVFEPGWKWSDDVAPMAGTKSCEADHTGYCLAGTMVIRMDNGEQFTIRAGDGFHIPPGHDAWVTGNEACVVLDVAGFTDYAKAKKAA